MFAYPTSQILLFPHHRFKWDIWTVQVATQCALEYISCSIIPHPELFNKLADYREYIG